MDIRICKHCKKKFNISDKPRGWMANHSRWCYDNPKRSEYNQNNSVRAMNHAKVKNGKTNQYTKAKLEGRIIQSPLKGRSGTFLNKKHSEESKKKMRESALASSHRRLRRNLIEYKGVLLDSSWELELAKRLDDLKIKWIRPNPLPWIDEEGVTHNYFPDFYLEEYDLFLDPKNPGAIKTQSKKLKSLSTQYSNIEIIDSLEKCKQWRPSI